MIATNIRMTLEEFEALPDEPDIERMLIRGVLWESRDVTVRNKWHSTVMSRLAQLLLQWADTQSAPRPVVAAGEAGCLLRRDPASRVGIDVAVFSGDVAGLERDDEVYFAGAPLLAAEILSPSDRQSEVQAKIDEYLASGVKLVWIVDSHFCTVIVHRPDAKPELFTTDELLSGDPHLPGLRVPVNQLFTR